MKVEVLEEHKGSSRQEEFSDFAKRNAPVVEGEITLSLLQEDAVTAVINSSEAARNLPI